MEKVASPQVESMRASIRKINENLIRNKALLSKILLDQQSIACKSNFFFSDKAYIEHLLWVRHGGKDTEMTAKGLTSDSLQSSWENKQQVHRTTYPYRAGYRKWKIIHHSQEIHTEIEKRGRGEKQRSPSRVAGFRVQHLFHKCSFASRRTAQKQYLWKINNR